MNNLVIPLQPDQTETEMQGGPKPLTPAGGLEIDAAKGNPDETVQLGADYVDDSGVEVSKEVEQQFDNTPPPVIPIPSKDGQESE